MKKKTKKASKGQKFTPAPPNGKPMPYGKKKGKKK